MNPRSLSSLLGCCSVYVYVYVRERKRRGGEEQNGICQSGRRKLMLISFLPLGF